MPEHRFWVEGEPATFATAGERAWKDLLVAAIALAPADAAPTGVRLDFVVSSLLRRGQGFDLDNLCDPVFGSFKPRKWFGGQRNAMEWWQATRRVGAPPGCSVTFCEGCLPPIPAHAPLASGSFPGPLPATGPVPGLADWAGSVAPPPSVGALALHVRFEGRVHIGEVCNGAIKSVIDGLYPWIGGSPRRPDDHRIEALYVERGAGPGRDGGVHLTLWALPTENAPGLPGAGKGP